MNPSSGKTYAGDGVARARRRGEELLDVSLEVHERVTQARREKAARLRDRRRRRNLRNAAAGGLGQVKPKS